MAINGVMFQYFHWFLPSSCQLWKSLANDANHLRSIGVDAVWIPPPQKCRGGSGSNGYDVFDHFDLGEFDQCGTIPTKYGSRQELEDAINALHGFRQTAGRLTPLGVRYVQVYVDIVLNQKSGGEVDPDFWQAIRVNKDDRNQELTGSGYERGEIEIKAYTYFRFPKRGGKYSSFEWRARHFDSADSTDSIRQFGTTFTEPSERYIYRLLHNELGYTPQDKSFGAWVSLEKGNYEFLSDVDIDFGRYDVREELKFWGAWLVESIGADGLRLDAVKHYTANYAREFTGHVRAQAQKALFTVGEYIDSETGPLHSYLTQVTAAGEYPQDISLFDFPLRFKFKNCSWAQDQYDLRELNRGTLLAEQPAKAVTFVENHDYQYGRAVDSHVREWIKPLAYAYILLRAGGYPCIFHGDYYGIDKSLDGRGQPVGKEYLDLLLQVRKQFALGEERYYDDRSVVGWMRMGGVAGARGALAVVINISRQGVRSVNMDTGRANKRFYHLATIKHTGSYDPDGFLVVRSAYDVYGDKSQGLYTGPDGKADFVADSGCVTVWLEDGVGLA